MKTKFKNILFGLVLMFSAIIFAEDVNKKIYVVPIQDVIDLGIPSLVSRGISLAESNNADMIIFDIDHFKEINDRFGHIQGDSVLIETGKTAINGLRKTDLVGRYGGDEFVIVLPNTDIQQGCSKAEQIRRAMSQIIVHEGYFITGSFGVRQLRADDNFTRLFERADQALYKAKRTGRNKVVAEVV